MKALVLDTSAYSHFRRGDEATCERMSNADVTYIPSIVLGDLRAGFELGTQLRSNVAMLDAFLDEAFVETIMVDACLPPCGEPVRQSPSMMSGLPRAPNKSALRS